MPEYTVLTDEGVEALKRAGSWDLAGRVIASPQSAQIIARYGAALERVERLEQALEKILETEPLADDSHEVIYALARKALDA